MRRRGICGDLNGVRALVADGLVRLDRELGETGRTEPAAVRNRLGELDDVLVTAAGGLFGWALLGPPRWPPSRAPGARRPGPGRSGWGRAG